MSEKEPKNDEVKAFLQNLKQNFNAFKNDTEVRNIMTRAEQLRAEGEARVLSLLDEKERQLSKKERQLSKKERQLSEKERELSESKKELSKKEEELAELKAMLASITTNNKS